MHKVDHLTSIKKWIEKLKVSFGSKIDDSHSGPKGPFTVLLRHTETYAEGRIRVVSCPCYFPYIESVPTSEFGATTDVRQAAGYDIWLAAVLPQSANYRRTVQSKTSNRRPLFIGL